MFYLFIVLFDVLFHQTGQLLNGGDEEKQEDKGWEGAVALYFYF